MRSRLVLVCALVGSIAVAVPGAGAFDLTHVRRHRASAGGASAASPKKEASKAALPDVSLYGGLGTWVDMYDDGPWDKPEDAAQKMASKGVTTLYLETSNYRKHNELYRPTMMARLLEAAHGQGIKVVAWYVPSFTKPRRDLRRVKAALDFRTPFGQQFDSFALDIEATVERDIGKRNTRMLNLSRRIRDHVGPTYALGAITPEAGASYWPSFPYAQIDQYFDVFLPMAYFTYRVQGMAAVRRYVATNVRTIRTATGNSAVPIHVIGGIAGQTTKGEVRGYLQAVTNNHLAGGSLYDFPITTRREWRALASLVRG